MVRLSDDPEHPKATGAIKTPSWPPARDPRGAETPRCDGVARFRIVTNPDKER